MGAPKFARGGELATGADRQRTDGGHKDRLVVEARARRLEGFDGSAWQVDVKPASIAHVADNPHREAIILQPRDGGGDDRSLGLEECGLVHRRKIGGIVGIAFEVPIGRAGKDQVGRDIQGDGPEIAGIANAPFRQRIGGKRKLRAVGFHLFGSKFDPDIAATKPRGDDAAHSNRPWPI